MDHQIFISHAKEDVSAARGVCEVLENQGFRCWLSSRDIPVGARWEDHIVDAISRAETLVLLFSERANGSLHVRRELGLAAERDIPLMPVRLDATKASGSLAYYLAGIQWIDAAGTSPARFDRLLQGLQGLSKGAAKERTQASTSPATSLGSKAPPPATEARSLGDTSLGRFLIRSDLRLGAVCEVSVGGAKGIELAEGALLAVRTFVDKANKLSDITWPYGLDAQMSFDGNIVSTALRLAAKGLERSGVVPASLAASLHDKGSLVLGTLAGGESWLLLRDQLTKQTGGSLGQPQIQEVAAPASARWLLTTGTHRLAVRQLLDGVPKGAPGSVAQLAVEGVGVVGAFW